MKFKPLRSIPLMLCMIFISSVGFAQDINIQLSNTYFIENATIIQDPETTLENASLIIRDGVIEKVGSGIEAPPDAIRIKADSMYIYPGFIDAYNNIGVKKQEENRQGRGGQGNADRPSDPGNPPNDQAGITPERRLSDVFEKGDKSISSARELGFTASISTPNGGMFPGMAAVVLHTDEPADQAIMKDELAMASTFATARRMYPATVIGVMSKYKDMYWKAKYSMKHQMAYDANPVGMQRPAYDKSIEALYPVVSGEMPVLFEAEKVKDVSRVLALHGELGFQPILANVKQGWHHLVQIKEKSIPVILSLDIPESEKKDEKKKKDEDDEEMDPAKKAMMERRDKAIEEYQSQAAVFAKAGLDISFTTKDMKSKDFKKNLQAMIDHGLTESQALAALTINPAKLYGINNIMGTVEEGKLANIFVSNAPFFETDSKIKYVFVDGKQFEYEIKEKKKKEGGESEPSADMAGTWEYTVNVPGDQREGQMMISKDGDTYKVKMMMEGEETEVEDVEAEGNALSFSFTMNEGGYSMKLDFNLTMDGDDLEGSVTAGDFGSFPIEGERISKPN